MERSRNIKIPTPKGDRAQNRSKAQRKDRLRRMLDDRLTEELSCQPIPFDTGEQEDLLFALPLSDEVKHRMLGAWKRKIQSEVL